MTHGFCAYMFYRVSYVSWNLHKTESDEKKRAVLLFLWKSILNKPNSTQSPYRARLFRDKYIFTQSTQSFQKLPIQRIRRAGEVLAENKRVTDVLARPNRLFSVKFSSGSRLPSDFHVFVRTEALKPDEQTETKRFRARFRSDSGSKFVVHSISNRSPTSHNTLRLFIFDSAQVIIVWPSKWPCTRAVWVFTTGRGFSGIKTLGIWGRAFKSKTKQKRFNRVWWWRGNKKMMRGWQWQNKKVNRPSCPSPFIIIQEDYRR